MSRAALLILLISITGCSDSSSKTDAASSDMTSRDVRVVDQRLGDAIPRDLAGDGTASGDTGSADSKTSDVGAHDASAADTAIVDSLAADTLSPDMPTSGCNAAKISFTQANPQKYEIYEFCFKAGATLTETQAKVIDPGLLCLHSGGGAFAKCASGKWRCSGILDRGPTGAVMQASWDMICLISQLPQIDTIVGGHYL